MTILTIRIVLTLALIYGVYLETGWATAVSLGLLWIAVEVVSFRLNRLELSEPYD